MEINKDIVQNSWVYKYKPQLINDIILPEKIINTIKNWIKTKSLSNGSIDFNLPNILLIGSPGIGKSTIINVVLNELGIIPLKINASLDKGIDVLRVEINEYIRNLDILNISTNRYSKKVIFLDEVDSLSPAFQNAFRSLIEEYYDKVRFVCTGNINNLNDALVSRFAEGLLDFNEIYEELSKEDIIFLQKKILEKLQNIIKLENGSYSDKSLIYIIKNHFPDYRKIVNYTYLQFIQNNGDVSQIKEEKKLNELLDIITKEDVGTITKYIWRQFNIEPIYKRLLDYVSENYKDNIAIKLMITIENYHYRHVSSAIDKKTNFLACCLEIKKILT